MFERSLLVAAVTLGFLVGGCGSANEPGSDGVVTTESAAGSKPASSTSVEPVTSEPQASDVPGFAPKTALEEPVVSPSEPVAAATHGSESSVTTGNDESSNVDGAKARPAVDTKPVLADEVAAFEIPPAWLRDVSTTWYVAAKPWKDGRVEIRRLLGLNDDASRREAIKLMWDYKLKNDMGNGHEYGMYTYLGKEPVWAVIAFRDELSHPDSSFTYPPYFAAQGLASILADYGEFEEAETILKRAATWRPPAPSGRFAKPGTSWVEVRQAESHDALGDLYAAWGKREEALKHYREAVRIFPTGKPPYGKHTLPRKAKKVQAKIDLIEGGSLASAKLKNGTYRANTIGYSGDVKLTVDVVDGKVADIRIDHQEKIDQGATKTIPDRIIEQQTLNVDGVTGATVTKDAIISGMLEALRKAGL